jgi:hypothetical protein
MNCCSESPQNWRCGNLRWRKLNLGKRQESDQGRRDNQVINPILYLLVSLSIRVLFQLIHCLPLHREMFRLELYPSKEELILLLSNLLLNLHSEKYQTCPPDQDFPQEIFTSLPASVFPERSEDDQGECF